MPLTHYTDRHLVRLLATETRRTDTSPHALAESHVALGRFLAGELVEHLELVAIDRLLQLDTDLGTDRGVLTLAPGASQDLDLARVRRQRAALVVELLLRGAVHEHDNRRRLRSGERTDRRRDQRLTDEAQVRRAGRGGVDQC